MQNTTKLHAAALLENARLQELNALLATQLKELEIHHLEGQN
jgi:hypothetical protein